MKLLRTATLAKAWTHIIGVPVAIVTFIVAVYSSWETISSASKTFQLSRVSALSESRKLFGDYEGIGKKAIKFNEDVKKKTIPPISDLLKKYKTGEQMYHSDELKDFRAVKDYFDQIGAFVKLGYLDFDLFFCVVAFPDSFWIISEPYRNYISKNWSNEKKELKDFDSNMNYLYSLYKEKRKKENLN
jgi:hypothetical protein